MNNNQYRATLKETRKRLDILSTNLERATYRAEYLQIKYNYLIEQKRYYELKSKALEEDCFNLILVLFITLNNTKSADKLLLYGKKDT